MKKNKKFFPVALCALLSILFVLSANVVASEVSNTGTSDAYYEWVADSDYGDSGGWIEGNEDEPMNDEYEQKDKEGDEERDEEYESIPSDSKDDSSSDDSSVEDDFAPVQEDQYM